MTERRPYTGFQMRPDMMHVSQDMGAEYFMRAVATPMLSAMLRGQEQQFGPQRSAEATLAAVNLSKYVQNEGIKNVVLLDRSARTAATALRAAWDDEHPGEKKPFNTFFINPRGFATEEDLSAVDPEFRIDRREREYLVAMNNRDFVQRHPSGRTSEQIQTDLAETFPLLVAAKDEPTLIFDVCIHQGTSAKPVLREFKDSGFSDLRFGVAGDYANHSGIVPDFIGLPGFREDTCIVFGSDYSMVKPFGAMTSDRTENPDDLRDGARLRNKLREVIKETRPILEDLDRREKVVAKPSPKTGMALEFLADTTGRNGSMEVSGVYRELLDLGFTHISDASQAIKDGSLSQDVLGRLANTVDSQTGVVLFPALRDAAVIAIEESQQEIVTDLSLEPSLAESNAAIDWDSSDDPDAGPRRSL